MVATLKLNRDRVERSGGGVFPKLKIGESPITKHDDLYNDHSCGKTGLVSSVCMCS